MGYPVTRRKAFHSVLGAASIVALTRGATFAADFDWKQKAGTKITIGFAAHSMSEALIAMLPEFKELTGITVKYEVAPENDFRVRLNAQLAAGDGSIDIFMTGPATNREYSAGKWIENLQPYIDNPAKTDAKWDFADFFQSAVNVNRWTGEPFGGLGSGPL